MSELSAFVLSHVGSLPSALFEELHSEKLLSKAWYKARKMLLPKCECVILDDYSFSRLELKDAERKYVLLACERILSFVLNDQERANLKVLKINSYDTYLLVVSKKLKRIVNNMRFLHNRSKFIVFVSSYALAKQLKFRDKHIHSYQMSDELYQSVVSKGYDTKEVSHFNYMRESQRLHKYETFESFKQLNNYIMGLTDCQMKYRPSGEIILKEHSDDEM